jgi:SagB-type dehydrogenase family enzyme
LNRLVRNPDLLISWSEGELFVEDLRGGDVFSVSPDTILLLDSFSGPRNPSAAADSLADYDRRSVLRSIDRFRRLGLLIPEREGRRRLSRIEAWKGNLASARYHLASRDIPFVTSPAAGDHFLQARLAAERPPPKFKRYRGADVRRRRLPVAVPVAAGPGPETARGLEQTLAARRTVREFTRTPVRLEDLAAIVRGTWGRTGWLDAGEFGRLPLKTSPSAGCLHPIECYVIAWNVAELPAGLYHYDVASDELRRLRSGDLRAAAVRAASGQRWVGRAAFLCVMTAVFERTLWKYQIESAYRVLWLDAGHLAQTFCLLATSRGLGPFTTAAIQDTFVENLIGLHGVKEFPVYLCGAGVPASPPRPLGR